LKGGGEKSKSKRARRKTARTAAAFEETYILVKKRFLRKPRKEAGGVLVKGKEYDFTPTLSLGPEVTGGEMGPEKRDGSELAFNREKFGRPNKKSEEGTRPS